MRVAPSVQIDCGPQGAWLALQQALYGASVATVLGWALGWAEVDGWLAALAALGTGLATAAGAGRVLRVAKARLSWNGAHWVLQPAADSGPIAGRAEVMIDLGAWMLVRFRPEQRGVRDDRWLALGRPPAGAAWHSARVALFAALPPVAQPVVADGARPAA